MIKAPRSLELRSEDNEQAVRRNVMTWARDVVRYLRALPSVEFVPVTIPSGADRFVAVDGRPRSVTVAQVLSGTATAAPGIEWEAERGGFRVSALHGFSGEARLVLRVEVL